MRGDRAVRIVVDGHTVDVFGPGAEFNHSEFSEQIDAVLHHAALEDALVRGGFTLEGLISERRAGTDRRAAYRGPERRRVLRLLRLAGQRFTPHD